MFMWCDSMFSLFAQGETGGGKVVQRFPEKDWPDVPFTPGIEMVIFPLYTLTDKYYNVHSHNTVIQSHTLIKS